MSEPGADPREPGADPIHPPDPAQAPPADARPGAPLAPRPLIERIGLAAVALFVGGLFTLMAGAAWVGEEGFLRSWPVSAAS